MEQATVRQRGVRREAIRALGGFPSHRDDIIPDLLKVLSEEEDFPRWMSMESLAKLGARGPALESVLQEMLASGDEHTRWDAYHLLAALGDPPVAFIEQARAVAEGDPRSAGLDGVKYLTVWAWEPEKIVHCGPDAVDAAPVKYLARLASDPGSCQRAVSALVQVARNENVRIRLAALDGLREAHPSQAAVVLDALRESLTDSSYEVVRTGVLALEAQGAAARGAVPRLKELKEQYSGSLYEQWDRQYRLKPLPALIDAAIASLDREPHP